MENTINQIELLKQKYPKYLDSLVNESILDIFDTFHSYSSANEDFYIQSSSISLPSVQDIKSELYTRYDDFEAGYEKEKYDKSIISTMNHEDNKIKKVYLKDLLKIDFSFIKYEEINQNFLISPKKKIILNNSSKNLNPNKKKLNALQDENFNFKSDNFKILTLSNDYNFNYKILEPYIKNCIKYEDTSNNINLIDHETGKEISFQKINFRDSLHEKKLIGTFEISDMVSRAEILVQPRYDAYYGTMVTIMKFFTFLKKLHDKTKKHRASIENSMNNTVNIVDGQEKRSSNKEETIKLKQIKNEIITFKNLNDFFMNHKLPYKYSMKNSDEIKEIKITETINKNDSKNENDPSIRDKIIVDEIKKKLQKLEQEKKEHLHSNLKEKMRNLLFNEDESLEYINQNTDGTNEDIDNANDTLIGINNTLKRDLNTSNGTKYKRRNNIRIAQMDNEIKEPPVELVPQHQTKFAFGLKKYIQSQLKQKNKNK